MPEWLIWFLIGAVLIAFEAIVAFTLYAGALSLGAFPASIAAAAGASIELQVAIFAAGAAFSLVVIRPIARRHLEVPAAIRTGTDTLLGQEATVTEPVDGDGGQVRVRGGSVWSARAQNADESFEAGTRVAIRQVSGVTLLVAGVAESGLSTAEIPSPGDTPSPRVDS